MIQFLGNIDREDNNKNKTVMHECGPLIQFFQVVTNLFLVLHPRYSIFLIFCLSIMQYRWVVQTGCLVLILRVSKKFCLGYHFDQRMRLAESVLH